MSSPQGRRWEEVSSRFEEVWVMALRAMDDIKESVRQAATKLIRTLRGLTLRLCDPAHTPKVRLAWSVTKSQCDLHGLLTSHPYTMYM
eukprot:scaffold176001_cov36-Prasinocladus_malaysianus.AAC.1